MGVVFAFVEVVAAIVLGFIVLAGVGQLLGTVYMQLPSSLHLNLDKSRAPLMSYCFPTQRSNLAFCQVAPTNVNL